MSSAPDLTDAPSFGVSGAAGSRSISASWIWRPVFGVLLAGVAVGATVWGGLAFLAFLSVGCVAAVREWHRLFTRDYVIPAILTSVTMIAALLLQLYARPVPLQQPLGPLIVLTAGAIANCIFALVRREPALPAAAGVLYIAFPALALLMIRASADEPLWSVLLVFLAIWSTDTGALFAGKLIGGPKLAPRLSPKKTWAGSVGGLACAALVVAGLALLLHVNVLPAMAFAVILSLAGQAGDLFESMIKRRNGCKDSGGLIPGHGGVLDRIDSVLFAAPVAAGIIFLLHWNPASGGHL